MTIDPHAIRAEPFAEVGTLIQRDAGLLIERWRERAVQDQPQARTVHRDALLDDLPRLLEEVGRSLAAAGVEANGHRQTAGRHGLQRWEAGWSLGEVVRDYQILRLVILEYLEENLDRAIDWREAMAVGLALDEAIEASIAAYTRHRDEHVRAAERARAEEERRRAESLAESERRKDEFLAVLAHELRNFLAPVVNALELLRLAGSPDPTLTRAREIADRQMQQMVRVVDDLLDVTRIARGQMHLRKSAQELAAVVRIAVQASEPAVRARQHRLAVDLPAESPWVEADPARLVQVLVNLLTNAAKYTSPGGEIRLRVTREGEAAVIRVRDNGVGIPADMLDRIFDPFTQLGAGPERSGDGLGIGLTLVRRLTELHGGTVTAHSAGPGRGSEFVLRLPVCPAGAPTSPPAGDRAVRPRRILIVEDNADGRETLKALLGLLGHTVATAATGREGIERAAADRPQVALIDIGLPDLSGYDVARQVRAALGDAVYLVALTGYGQDEDRRRTLEAGFDAHVVKPVDPDELTRLFAVLPAAQS